MTKSRNNAVIHSSWKCFSKPCLLVIFIMTSGIFLAPPSVSADCTQDVTSNLITLSCDNGQRNTGFHGDDGKTVTVTLNNKSNIEASGANSAAIYWANKVTIDATSQLKSTQATALIGTDSADEFSIAGTVFGGNGTAINAQGGNDNITVFNTASITGSIDGGTGEDALILAGKGGVYDFDIANIEALRMETGAEWEIASDKTLSIANAVFDQASSLEINGEYHGNIQLNHASATVFGTGTVSGNFDHILGELQLKSNDEMQIKGNYKQSAGANLIIMLDGNDIDKTALSVAGLLTLGGTLQIKVNHEYDEGTIWTVMTSASGIEGQFSGISDDSDNYNFSLALSDDKKSLDLILEDISPTTPSSEEENSTPPSEEANRALYAELPGLGVAGSRVGAQLDSLFADGQLSELEDVLSALSAAEQVSHITSQSGGIALQSVEAASNMMSVNGYTALSRVTIASDARLAIADGAVATGFATGDMAGNDQRSQRWTGWLEGNRGFGKVDTDQNARGYDYQMAGFAMGAESDGFLTQHDRFGLFYAWSQSDSTMDRIQPTSNDKSQSNLHQMGIYGGYKGLEAIELASALSLGYITVETTRNTNATGIATGKSNGYSLALSGEMAWDFNWSEQISIKPLLGFDGAHVHINPYNETGAGVSNLRIATADSTSLKLITGFRIASEHALNELLEATDQGWKLSSTGQIAVARQVLDTRSKAQVNYLAAASNIYTSQSFEKAATSLKLDLSMEFSKGDIDDFLIGYAGYNGEAASNFQDHALTVGIKVKW